MAHQMVQSFSRIPMIGQTYQILPQNSPILISPDQAA
jgi:hypothetical protein